jgi:heptosyltransferase II
MRKKVLIIKIGAIGDVAMSLPMGEALSDCDIDWLVGTAARPVVEWAGCAKRIIEVNHQKLLEAPFFIKLWHLSKVWVRLFGKKYDLVITAHPNYRYRVLTLFCLKKEHRQFRPIPGRYHPHEYNTLAGGKKLQWPQIPERERKFVVLAPGGDSISEPGKGLRQWPIENFVVLAKMLGDVVIIGGPKDEWIKPFFLGFTTIIGTKTIPELIDFFTTCRLVITHDSGPLHLARLGGAKVLALFGPTMPDEKSREHVIWGGEHLACRPCYTGRTYAPCKRPLCMHSITPERVFAKVQDIL